LSDLEFFEFFFVFKTSKGLLRTHHIPEVNQNPCPISATNNFGGSISGKSDKKSKNTKIVKSQICWIGVGLVTNKGGTRHPVHRTVTGILVRFQKTKNFVSDFKKIEKKSNMQNGKNRQLCALKNYKKQVLVPDKI